MNFFDEPETKAKTETNTDTEFVSLAEIVKRNDVRDAYFDSMPMMKVADILERPICITGYEETTMKGMTGEEKPCFKMDFYFTDDEKKNAHFIRTEATRLWNYLKAINQADPGILASGTVTTVILKGKLKGKYSTEYYYFDGTE